MPRKSGPKSAKRRAKAVAAPIHGTPAEERRTGEVSYLDVLKTIHSRLAPRRYLEIGVRRGTSLVLAKRRAVGVDPQPIVTFELPRTARVVKTTSDRYFKNNPLKPLGGRPDLVFIDGMHHFEFALRDFMNAEAISPRHGLIVMDDIYPNHPAQAERKRRTSAWTGDVWKVAEVLRTERPDLVLLWLDTAPTGLLVAAGLDASNTVLKTRYRQLLGKFDKGQKPPRRILTRRAKTSPKAPKLNRLLKTLKLGRERKITASKLRTALSRLSAR